ncbi:ABC transporter permease [Paenibacillus sp. SI8]|uniref:ABC transporter permease n=1 Tax=unclassified Paenibacillus TaxID=185978 RepID=UPI0034672551
MESAEHLIINQGVRSHHWIQSVFSKRSLPVVVILFSLLAHLLVPNRQVVASNSAYTGILLLLAVFYAGWSFLAVWKPNVKSNLSEHAPLASLSLFLFVLWELLTQKWGLLPMPYFPSQIKVLDAIIHEFDSLAVSTAYSLRLLVLGYTIGTILGLATGILMGWYHQFRYWVNPFIRILGPIPSTAWIPIVLVVFPTSFSASVFLLVLAAWFPVTVMTWTGISNVNKSFFEVAKTLGANEQYLIRKIAIPAAFPQIFIGLFMGTGTSFVTLIVAEMLGVKAGLGFYITWAQGWGEYYKVYAALFIMALLFSGIITLLFKVKDKVLIWQKGLIKW